MKRVIQWSAVMAFEKFVLLLFIEPFEFKKGVFLFPDVITEHIVNTYTGLKQLNLSIADASVS